VTLISWFSGEVLSKLADYIHAWYPTVSAIVSDPMGYVLAIVWARITDLICYGLAYGLGTTIYTLPTIPDWTSGTRNVPGGSVPPSASLTKPLARLYVSGYTFSASHHGVDFGLSSGEPVYAAHNGQVLEAGWNNAGYGIDVVLYGAPWWTRYGHLKSVAVTVGQSVRAGQVIGYGDTTGNSTGNHLHFEVKYNGQFVNPLDVL